MNRDFQFSDSNTPRAQPPAVRRAIGSPREFRSPISIFNIQYLIFNIRKSSAFTLVEIMFAVITLGIGLIMVAAMFPIAIQQTKLTSEEGMAAAIARAGMSQIAELGQMQSGAASLLPATGTAASATGKVQALSTTAWQAIRGNVVLASDPRYAWVPLYRRNGDPAVSAQWDQTAQIFIIPVKVRNASLFQAPTAAFPLQGDALTPTTAGAAPFNVANFIPRAVNVTISLANQTITFNSGVTDPVVEGCYVIIADDHIKTPAEDIGRMNGRIYRVGAFSGTTNLWSLWPGYGFTTDNGADGTPGTADDINAVGADGTAPSTVKINPAGSGADAFIVGRGFDSPTAPTMFTGPTMDIAAYTGFITVK